MNLAVLLIALVGTTTIVVDSTLFRPVRKLWPALLECAQCVGFWVGAAAGVAGLFDAGHGRALNTFIAGASTSVLSLLVSAVLLNLLGDVVDERKEP